MKDDGNMTDQLMDTNQNNTTESADTTGDNTNTQEVSSKTFTQDEVNAIVAKRVASTQKKFDGVDLEEYNTLKSDHAQAEEAKMMKRQEFDKVLKQTKDGYDTEVNKLKSELTKVRVDGALVNAASKHKATNPDHVAQLLRDTVRLDDGQPVVLDADGQVRYNIDTAELYSIDNLVDEFINQNPYFKAPGKPGTSSVSNTTTQDGQEFDLAKLDLTKAEHRQVYKELQASGKI